MMTYKKQDVVAPILICASRKHLSKALGQIEAGDSAAPHYRCRTNPRMHVLFHAALTKAAVGLHALGCLPPARGDET
eukprot:6178411-Pleurochrysis_carterae.AAC.3